MKEILSQEEIDQLLKAISADRNNENKFSSIEYFEKFILKRNQIQEKPYGIFDKDISICSYFKSVGNEKFLEEIRLKNENEGYGNIKIPNTNMIQYTPFNLILNLIDGTNVRKGDFLFDQWK